jgi:hypothetical protein
MAEEGLLCIQSLKSMLLLYEEMAVNARGERVEAQNSTPTVDVDAAAGTRSEGGGVAEW